MSVFRCPGGISNGDLHGETMKTILSILLWIWQAPQNIVGLALRLWYRGRVAVVLLYDHHCGGVSYRVVPDLPGGGISLGATVLVRYWFIDAPELYADTSNNPGFLARCTCSLLASRRCCGPVGIGKTNAGRITLFILKNGRINWAAWKDNKFVLPLCKPFNVK